MLLTYATDMKVVQKNLPPFSLSFLHHNTHIWYYKNNFSQDGWETLYKRIEESSSSLKEIGAFFRKIYETESAYGKQLQKVSKVQFDKKGAKTFRKSRVMEFEEG